ncbi:MAG: hypothetical protein H3C30_14675 [Candidatus Hydrogenedentes bacterium]|nr:hypothetical protein [Candidatus Hydrogenedentota bacterium]
MRKYLQRPLGPVLVAALFAMLLCPATTHALGLNAAMKKAQAHVDSGEPDKAAEILRELQVDHPDSPMVAYALGSALYASAKRLAALETPDTAIEAYAEAERHFARAAQDTQPDRKREAEFARITAKTGAALLISPEERYEDALRALRETVAAHEQFLREHPGHAGAENNLDLLRLKLKELLQHSPEQQEQEKQDQPPDDNKQPMDFFLNVGTDLPGATVESEGNTARLVVPEGGGARP